MALKQDAKDKLKALGFDVDAFIKAVTASEEQDFAVPAGTLFTEEQLTARDTNTINSKKPEITKEAEKQGKELAIKAIKKKFGIEHESKDVEVIAELISTQLGKGDEGLKEQIKLLQKDKTTLEQKVTGLESEKTAIQLDTQLIGMFPTGRKDDMTDAERLMLTKSALTFETVDGALVVKRNGEILRDKATQAPLPPKKAVEDYFAERKWVGEQKQPGGGGRGGDDTPLNGGQPGVYTKMSDLEKDWTAKNPNVGVVSPEFEAHLQEVMKTSPNLNFYE